MNDNVILAVAENASLETIKDHYKFLSSVLKANIEHGTTGEKDRLGQLYNEVQQAYKNLSTSKAISTIPIDPKAQVAVPEEKKETNSLIKEDLLAYKNIVAERSSFSKLKRALMGEYLSKHELKAFELLRAGEVKCPRKAILKAKKLIKARGR